MVYSLVASTMKQTDKTTEIHLIFGVSIGYHESTFKAPVSILSSSYVLAQLIFTCVWETGIIIFPILQVIQ